MPQLPQPTPDQIKEARELALDMGFGEFLDEDERATVPDHAHIMIDVGSATRFLAQLIALKSST